MVFFCLDKLVILGSCVCHMAGPYGKSISDGTIQTTNCWRYRRKEFVKVAMFPLKDAF